MSPFTTLTRSSVPSSTSAEETTTSRLSTVTRAPNSTSSLTSWLPSSPYAPVTNTDLRSSAAVTGFGIGRSVYDSL